MKAIFVDDDAKTNFYHKIILEEHGLEDQAIFFQSPEKALAHLKNKKGDRFDILFLDINMPRMSGWEFLIEMEKANITIPAIYIVSTSMNPRDVEKSKQHPMVSAFISKPIDIDDIANYFT